MRVFEGVLNAIKTFIRGPMTKAEVDRVLAEAAAKKGEKLDWQHSIVDLLKVLDLDSSLQSRQGLADELGYTAAVDGSAESNIRLHKVVMDAVAERCVTVPKE